jgi:hypothetical protein
MISGFAPPAQETIPSKPGPGVPLDPANRVDGGAEIPHFYAVRTSGVGEWSPAADKCRHSPRRAAGRLEPPGHAVSAVYRLVSLTRVLRPLHGRGSRTLTVAVRKCPAPL